MVSMTIEENASELSDVDLLYSRAAVYATVEGSTGRSHSCGIHFDGRRLCDCRGFYYQSHCSHLEAMIREIPSRDTREHLRDALDTDPTMPKQTTDLAVRTTLPPFNEMMSPTDDGNHPLAGIPKRTGIAMSGRPEAGKTITSFQLAHEVMAEGGPDTNALLFDTEGSLHTYYGWKETFQNRFGLDTEIVEVEPKFVNGTWKDFDYTIDPDVDHQIFLMDIRDLENILAVHGRPANIDTEDDKIKLAPDGNFESDIRDTPIGQFCFQEDVEYLVYDSITNPLETFTNRQQDRPTRAKATAWWMLQAQALAEKRDMVQVFITHLSKNPTNPYDRPDILGGKNVKHQVKYSIYMRQSDGSERAMKLFRHPSKEPWDDQWHMSLEGGKGMVPTE